MLDLGLILRICAAAVIICLALFVCSIILRAAWATITGQSVVTRKDGKDERN